MVNPRCEFCERVPAYDGLCHAYMKVSQAQIVIPPRAIAVFLGRFCKASLDRILMDIAHQDNKALGVVARFTLESVL